MPLPHPSLLPASSHLLLCPTWPTDPSTAFYKSTTDTTLFSWALGVQRKDYSTAKTGGCLLHVILKNLHRHAWGFLTGCFSPWPQCITSLHPSLPPSTSSLFVFCLCLSLCPPTFPSTSLFSPGSQDPSQVFITTPKSFSSTVTQGDLTFTTKITFSVFPSTEDQSSPF